MKFYPKRYARAIFEVALENKEIEKWQTDLDTIAGLSADSVLLTLLESPRLGFEEKSKIVDERLPGITPMARNFTYILIARGKVKFIDDINEQYHRLVDEYRGVRHAEVTTAVPLDDAEKKKIETELSALLGKKLVVSTKVDPGIVGGLVARVDGKLLEGSTKYKLETLKKELEG
jgi:F-type H+-transporting ATPase subunit delta